MAGVLSKKITLEYGAVTAPQVYTTTVSNVQSIPDIGGTKESVEVTTLADDAHMYINGLISYGDSLDFTCLYDEDRFLADSGLDGAYAWRVGVPDANTATPSYMYATFTGEPSAKVNGVGTGEAISYTLSVKPTSKITFGN